VVIELQDTINDVVHNKFHQWRKRNPRGMYLALVTKRRANLHGTPCHHMGTRKWSLGDKSSLTKKLKVLGDGPGSLNRWASERGIGIHVCYDCQRNGYIHDQVSEPPRQVQDEAQDQVDDAREDRAIYARKDIGATEKQALVSARRKQGVFRERVIQAERRCRLTGVDDADHLRASHIKPWKVSTDKEKLDGNNGLLLAPHIDHLFDRGYISFRDSGQVIVSKVCPKALIKSWGINLSVSPQPVRGAQRPYLAYHRGHVLKK
jgi:hypothetical protein